MDDFTEKYLRLWGLEHLTEHFKEKKIGKAAFLDLTESRIAELVPKIGHRSKMLYRLKLLKKDIQKEMYNRLHS